MAKYVWTETQRSMLNTLAADMRQHEVSCTEKGITYGERIFAIRSTMDGVKKAKAAQIDPAKEKESEQKRLANEAIKRRETLFGLLEEMPDNDLITVLRSDASVRAKLEKLLASAKQGADAAAAPGSKRRRK